jgi:hypothetical protein
MKVVSADLCFPVEEQCKRMTFLELFMYLPPEMASSDSAYLKPSTRSDFDIFDIDFEGLTGELSSTQKQERPKYPRRKPIDPEIVRRISEVWS